MFVDSFHGFHYFWIAYFCDIKLWAFYFLLWNYLLILKIHPVLVTLVSDNFDPENVVLWACSVSKYHIPEAAQYIYADFSCIPWRVQKINQWQRGKLVQKLWCGFPEQSLELVRVFIEASKIFTLIFIFVFG
jgi:hypothetical protein